MFICIMKKWPPLGVLSGTLVCTLFRAFAAESEHTGSAGSLVFIGTYTNGKSKGIYHAKFDSVSGRLGNPELAVETKNPSFIAIDRQQRHLYAVSEVSQLDGKATGGVSAFSIDASGKLKFLAQQPSGGTGPCHLSLDRSGKCLLVANYGSGSIAVLPLHEDGTLAAPTTEIQHTGSSTNPKRQTGPHAHFITPSPDDRFALACDLGLDKILVYHLDPLKASLTPNEPPFISVEPGSGPRHVAFHPNGRLLCLINEMGGTLMSFRYDPERGRLEYIETLPTLPKDFIEANTSAEIQFSPSGKFLYASNRGHNSIAVFAVNERTGHLSFLERQSTEGKTPRFFTLDPSGNWLLAANQDSDSIVMFRVDRKTGRITPTGQQVEVGAPVCCVFLTSS